MKRYSWMKVMALVVFAGCAGTQRSCASYSAGTFGADWVVAQYDMSGHPYRCWELHEVSISNEEGSDGIYWMSGDGHLVHISGNYNRVQVGGGEWDSAFRELGLTQEGCAELTGYPR